MSDDEELQFVIELSKKTFKEEEAIRTGENDLIRFDSPDEPKRRKQIEEITRLYRIPGAASSSSLAQRSPYYGFRRSLDDNFPVASFSTPASPLSPPGTFVPFHFADPPPRPPKPPEFQPHHFPPNPSLTLLRGTLPPPPPPLPPKSQRIRIPANTNSTPLRHSTPSFSIEQSNLSPIVQSFNNTFSSETTTSNEETTSNEHSYQYQPLTHLYVPYTMTNLNSSYGALLNGDLIDLRNMSAEDSENESQDNIRREFDPLYCSFPAEELPVVQLHFNKDVTTDEIAVEDFPPVKKREYQQVPFSDIALRSAPDPIEQQVSKICKRGLIQRIKTPNFFIAPTVDYMTTTANPIQVIFYPEQNWGKQNESSKTMTININETVELMTAQALSWFKSDAFEDPTKYGLKIYGCNQFLAEDSLLGSNLYTGHSLLHGEDVKLELAVFESQKNYEESFEMWGKMKSQLRYSAVIDKEDVENVLTRLAVEMSEYEKAFDEGSTLILSQTSQRVKQVVKMLCKHLHSIVPEKLYGEMQRYLSATTEDQLTFHRNDFLRELHLFLELFCRCTISRYMLPPLRKIEKAHEEVLAYSQSLQIMLNSVHCIPEIWIRDYSEFYMSVDLYYGTQVLDGHSNRTAITCKFDQFFPRIPLDLYAKFTRLNLNLYPKETRIVVSISGTLKTGIQSQSNPTGDSSVDTEILAYCSVPLFDENSLMRQGPLLLPLTRLKKQPLLKPFGPYMYINDPRDPILIMSFKVWDTEIFFPRVSVDLQCIPQEFATLDTETREYLEELIEQQDPSKLEQDDQEMIWQKRLYLTKKPDALPLVLASLSDWSFGFLSQVYQILEEWAPLRPELAMQLLLPQFPDERIRSYAVQWLAIGTTDFLFHTIAQFIEALRFELYEKSALADFIFELASVSLDFAHEIYWQLQQRVDHSAVDDLPYAIRCQSLQQKIVDEHESPLLRNDIKFQHELLHDLDSIQDELRSRTGDSEQERLYRLRIRLGELDAKLLQRKVRLPICPSFDCTGVRVEECGIFNSNAKPLKIVFRGLNSDYSIIHKCDDDMRQDAFVMKMVNEMDRIWKSNGLDLSIITFRIMPVGYRRGMGQLVLNCATLLEIQKEDGLRGVLNDEVLRKWLMKHNSSEYNYKRAHGNFIRSCAAWCIVTYVLGIGDRHNDNILFTKNGHVFHIDFGKYMGDWQMAGGFRRDRVPFVFTTEMFYVINGGKTPTENNQLFLDYCCQALHLLRKNKCTLTNLLRIMACSGIPGINLESIDFVEKNLMLNLSDADATSRFTELIKESMNSSAVKLNFYAHAFAQFMSSSSSFTNKDENKLSFVPQLYTEHTDGKMKMVRVIAFEKRNLPNKVYVYKVEVMRENVAVSTYVYRSYAEFAELHSKLKKKFPSFSYVLNTGTFVRSNVRAIAQKRMIDVQCFLRFLFSGPLEISHCDLVYTFFHSLLRDNEEADEMVTSNSCQVYLTITHNYNTQTLSIFVAHVRNLSPLPTGQIPDSYVKTYIRPDLNETSKRKTQVARCTQAPTFNQVLVYENFPASLLSERVLDVSVWNKGGIESHKMYMACIPLQKLNAVRSDRKGDRILKDWFPFDKYI